MLYVMISVFLDNFFMKIICIEHPTYSELVWAEVNKILSEYRLIKNFIGNHVYASYFYRPVYNSKERILP